MSMAGVSRAVSAGCVCSPASFVGSAGMAVGGSVGVVTCASVTVGAVISVSISSVGMREGVGVAADLVVGNGVDVGRPVGNCATSVAGGSATAHRATKRMETRTAINSRPGFRIALSLASPLVLANRSPVSLNVLQGVGVEGQRRQRRRVAVLVVP